jgi:metal-responsive CopG/Arc/MetJ family transcriptional regulator
MATGRISVRIDEHLQEKVSELAAETGASESMIVRQAIQEYIARQEPQVTCYDVAKKAGLIGSIPGLPADLSTNPKYFEGFGRD